MFLLIKRIFGGIILNIFAVLVCERFFNYLLNDFDFRGNTSQLIIFCLILTGLNLLLKPVLRLIFLPLVWLTLGIFILVINLIILKTAVYLVPDVLVIKTTLGWLGASIVISIFNSFIYRIK